MNEALIAILIFLAVAAFWLLWQNLQGRQKTNAVESQMSELRRDLQTMATAQAQNAGQMEAIAKGVAQRLDSVTPALQEAIKNSAQITGQLTSDAQTHMASELKNTRDQINQIQRQLGEVQQAGKEMSQTAQTLQNVLGGAKSRGSLGEVALERLLEDALPKERYQRQFRFTTGEVADAVIFLRDKLLPIDSKFPLDAFRRLSEQKTAPAAPAPSEEPRRSFATAVKGHADSIAKKYILPNEGTLAIAFMFVPSENVYYELLMTADAKGQPLDEYCRSKNVIAVSPNTLYAHLQVILMGLQGMQIEENAKRLQASLAGMQKHMDNLGQVFARLGTHLKNAQICFSESEKRLDKAQDTLTGMLGGERTERVVESSQGTLALPLPEASAKKSA